MPRIHLLDRETAELIAAGEVIERPSSVVKELVENAIDSGATAVTVEIKSGGVRFIRVTDNGCGILREDIPTAFLRHATSKVLTREDLGSIGTLGFRGEALASICAVGRVELLTRTREEAIGTRYEIAGGEEKGMDDAGCPAGTTIIVRDLFYNVPARMKFLKKDSTEGNAVAALLDRLALSHPEVAFQFIREGQRKLRTPGDGKLLSAVFGVYGSDFGDLLVPVSSAGGPGGLVVDGFITRPEGSRASRAMEHFFINHRYVKCLTMMAALEEAYKNSIMTGKYPGCVLDLTVPLGMVDVNVHPAKLEVKLSDERQVFQAVYAACKGALSSLDSVTRARDTSRSYQNRLSYFEITGRPLKGEQQRMTPAEYRRAASLPPREKGPAGIPVAAGAGPTASPAAAGPGTRTLREEGGEALYRAAMTPRTIPRPAPDRLSRREPTAPEPPLPVPPVEGTQAAVPGAAPGRMLTWDKPPAPPEAPAAEGGEQGQAPAFSESRTPAAPVPAASETAPPTTVADVWEAPQPPTGSGARAPVQHPAAPAPEAPEAPGRLRFIGELFQTYILAEGPGELMLIDKHAAHERLLFEELQEQQAAGELPRQMLLTSLRVSLPKDRYDAVMQNLPALGKAGFGIEDFGDGSVLVREIPAVLGLDQAKDAVLEMAERLLHSDPQPTPAFFDELYHSIACKAAVKGNTFSGEMELQKLLDELALRPHIRNCPHGRPVMIAMTRREVEKMFGRVV